MTTGIPDPTWQNLYYPPADYAYFAEVSRYPFPAGTDARKSDSDRDLKAVWAADAAMLAYGRRGREPMTEQEIAGILRNAGFENYRLLGDWGQGGASSQAFFAENPEFAILAFRGTEAGNFMHAMIDAELLPAFEPDYTATDDLPPSPGLLKTLFDQRECTVHQGFQRGLNQMWAELQEFVSDYRGRYPRAEICFTGHSLGAGLATLTVSRFAIGNTSLFTFGSPRVGNKVFCQRVGAHIDLGEFRYVNGNDVVTYIPVESIWYSHVTPDFLYIDADGTMMPSNAPQVVEWDTVLENIRQLRPESGLWSLDNQAPGALVDHSPVRYCKFLWTHLLR